MLRVKSIIGSRATGISPQFLFKFKSSMFQNITDIVIDADNIDNLRALSFGIKVKLIVRPKLKTEVNNIFQNAHLLLLREMKEKSFKNFELKVDFNVKKEYLRNFWGPIWTILIKKEFANFSKLNEDFRKEKKIVQISGIDLLNK